MIDETPVTEVTEETPVTIETQALEIKEEAPPVKRGRGNPRGKPALKLPWDEIDQCLEEGMPGSKIALYIGIDQDTLYRHCQTDKGKPWSEYFLEKRSIGDRKLHQAQYEEAVHGRDKTMLIWLGKCRLNQQENFQHEAAGLYPLLQALGTLDPRLSKVEISLGSTLEARASVLDPGSERREDPVQNELGADPIVGESAPLLGDPQS